MQIFRSASRTRFCILAYSLATILSIVGSSMVSAADRPNVVIVITDDQGYGDLSCHGNPILKTPNIDSLFANSVRLTDYHVSPTCSPTRSALQTGHWTNRTGVWHTIMGRSMLRENEVTMGQIFKEAGYETGMFGKWHLGDNYPFRPEDRGYTEVLRHGGGGVGQTPDYWDNAYFDGAYWHNSQPVPVKGFCTDVFFDYAKKFIKKSADANKPFLAYISSNAPHGPMHSPEEYSEPYKESVPNVGRRNFFGMIANIDDNVGKLRAYLDELELTDNTIFIFTTDNGTSSGDVVFNAVMRGKKGSEYDGGHRVPFFMHWPNGNLMGGKDILPITAHVDVVPTLIDLCDISAPSGVKFDGRSFAPLLNGNTADWPDRILVTDSQRVKDPIKWRKSAVMTSRWRLINGKELYDMTVDPGQAKDVAPDHTEVVQRLASFYEAWWAELLPTFDNATAIYLGHPAENPARLTSHDWITTGGVPWHQGHVRSAYLSKGDPAFWNVHVFEGGDYEIRLRRWPREIDLAINAPLAPGEPVPGEAAFREKDGVAIDPIKAYLTIGDETDSTPIKPGAKEVVFEMKLPAGKTKMTAMFELEDGQRYGAYFAYVRKK